MKQCRNCGTQKAPFWYLRDYYNVSGTFCGPCYDKVSHDSYGRPNRPYDYLLMLLKFGASK